jgi:hypothetical protein
MSLAFAQPSNAGTPLGPYVIENVGSEMAGNALCARPRQSGPDIQLVQQDCANADAHWWFWPLGSGNYHIQNTVTGNRMRALSNTDFSPVQSIDCKNISDEKWSLQVAPSGGHLELISHVAGGSRCLDVQEGA